MSRALLLARTFFARFFESDLMPQGLPQAQMLIWSLAGLAAPALLLPIKFASAVANMGPDSQPKAVMIFRLLFITWSMTGIGLVALMTWDGMFPDRRDARILSALPVPGSILIGARLLALGALCGIFLVGMNVIPSLGYGSMMVFIGGASNIFLGVMAHFISTTLAGLFVFATLMVLQGVVLNVGGRRAADRLSVALQILFVTTLLQMIFFLPRMGGVIAADLNSGWSRALPSVWFLGLYDLLGGRPVAGAPRLALFAVIAVATMVAGAMLLFVATHGRLTRLALESIEVERGGQRARKLRALLTRMVCRSPMSRAAFEFTLRTLTRSRSHRLMVSIYVGVALALAGSGVVPLALRHGLAGFMSPNFELLAAPLMLSFLTLIGIRVALAIPVEPRARWAVRIAEPTDRMSAMSGVRLALFVAGVVPSSIFAALSAGSLWGLRPALIHTFVCTIMGLLLVDILLIRLPKLPFTCTYLPGKAKASTLWPLYLTGFGTYAFTTARFELEILKWRFSMRALVIFTLLVATAVVALWIHRRLYLRGLQGFRFEEEDPDMLFTGFQLSEGYAATSKEVRQLR
jgi:hypothetical protein